MKRSLTAQCLMGLVLGLAVGMVLTRVYPAAVPGGVGVADGVIRLWTNALRLMVVPLVVSHLFLAITSYQAGKGEATRLGVSIPSVFLALLVFTAIITVLVTLGILNLPFFRGLAFPEVGSSVSPAGTAGAVPGTGSWIDDVVPPNLVLAALRPEAILGLMLFAIVFAQAARRLAAPLQQTLLHFAEAVRDTVFIVIGWLLRLVPLLLLALGYRSAVNAGLEVGKLLLIYLGVESIAILLGTALQYPLASFAGGVSLGRFARALFPAQVAAATTRSSLATVPLLLRDAEAGLGLPAQIAGVVIPLGGAMLKLSRMVSSPVKLIFIAHFLGLSLSIDQIIVFILTIMMLSPLTVGVPSVISGTRSLPAFAAAGIPVEYVVLLGATTWVVDIFLTIMNTTGYMSAAVLVSRLAGRRASAQPVAELQSKDPQATAG